MSSQKTSYFKNWQRSNTQHKRRIAIRLITLFVIFLAGLAMMFNMRSKVLGEDGATMAMYFLGVLFVLTTSLAVLQRMVRNPESVALQLCIAAVILAGAWVNFEEKVVMPFVASTCDDACLITYNRMVPFSDQVVTYTQQSGWRLLD